MKAAYRLPEPVAMRRWSRPRRYCGRGLKMPVNAAGGGVQRVNGTAWRTNKHTAAGHRWLRIRAQLSGEAEGPLSFKRGVSFSPIPAIEPS